VGKDGATCKRAAKFALCSLAATIPGAPLARRQFIKGLVEPV